MSLNYFTLVFSLLAGFAIVSTIGWFVADHLDRKYGTERGKA